MKGRPAGAVCQGMNHVLGRLDYISVQCQYIICKAFVWRMECEKGPSQGLRLVPWRVPASASGSVRGAALGAVLLDILGSAGLKKSPALRTVHHTP